MYHNGLGMIRCSSALRPPQVGIYVTVRTACRSLGITLKYSLRYSPVVVLFAGVAIVAAGCSDSRLAANDAASNGGQVQQSGYQAGYGLTSEGPTTDLYHELKGSLQPPERPQVAAAQQGAPASANGGQGPSTGANGQQVADSGPSVAGQQQQAGPPREEPTATVYGMSSDGPTTDLYTALFGSRNH